jgi:hypothetical protein
MLFVLSVTGGSISINRPLQKFVVHLLEFGSPVIVTLEQEGVQLSCLIFGLRRRQRLTMRVSLIFVSGGTFYRNVMHLCTARRFRYRIWRLSYRPLLLAGPGAPEGEGQMYINKSGPLFMRE